MAAGQTKQSRAKAAEAEAADETKTIEFRGVELEVPSKLPKTIKFDLGQIQAQEDAGDVAFGAIYNLLHSLLGAEQMARVRQALAEEGGDFDEDPDWDGELLEAILEGAGITAGES